MERGDGEGRRIIPHVRRTSFAEQGWMKWKRESWRAFFWSSLIWEASCFLGPGFPWDSGSRGKACLPRFLSFV